MRDYVLCGSVFVRLDIAALTDIGRRKDKNEDFYGVFREGTPGLQFFREGALLCVADGLGGHMGGEIASKLAVSNMKDMLMQPMDAQHGPTDPEDPANPIPQMIQGMQHANASVFKTNEDLVTNGRPMGTTLISVLVQPRKVYITNVGDSRCYHLRDREIIDKTEDHSWVDEQVRQGLMSKAEAEVDRRKNIVTRSIGTHELVEVDSYIWDIVPGDILMLCTDGLVNMVRDKEIAEEFEKGGTCAEIAQRLVQLANDNGGKDNITVVIAHISPSLFRMIFSRVRSYIRRNGVSLFWILISLVCFLGGVGLGYFFGLYDVFSLGIE